MFLLNVLKVFGVARLIVVAANTFSFLQIHRRKMAPFENPIDESKEVCYERLSSSSQKEVGSI